jgi:hypothetical protein
LIGCKGSWGAARKDRVEGGASALPAAAVAGPAQRVEAEAKGVANGKRPAVISGHAGKVLAGELQASVSGVRLQPRLAAP